MLTTEVADPTGYGRILREPGTGDVLGIVEEKDADDEQRAITEINSSIYVFDAAVLRGALGRLGRDNAQGEVYLTDVLAIARTDGGHVRALRTDDPVLVEGVNDRVQLSVLRAEMNRRILEDWMREGVTVVDPATTWVDVDVELERDVTLLPGTQLHGATVVREGATVGPDTTLTDVEVGPRASVVRTHGTLAVIGADASVGPFAYLRPGTVLGDDGQDRHVRRDEERADRHRLEGPAPVLRGRRDDRRAHEHRRGVGDRQLRRRQQAPHDHRLVRPHGRRQHVRRARDHRRRRVHRRRQRHPPRRALGRARRERGRAAQHRGLGRARRAPGRPPPRRSSGRPTTTTSPRRRAPSATAPPQPPPTHRRPRRLHCRTPPASTTKDSAR